MIGMIGVWVPRGTPEWSMSPAEKLMLKALQYAALAEDASAEDRHRLLRLAYALRASAERQDWLERESIPLQPTALL